MDSPASDSRALWRGGWIALLAAVTFGITTPFVQRFGRQTGSFCTAGLLYVGAAMGTLQWPTAAPNREAPVRIAHGPRILAIAVIGAALAPACLAWGLQHTGAASASLLLNFEAVFTLLLSWAIYSEPIGRRVAVAVALMIFASGTLLVSASDQSHAALLGMVAILAATMGWAADNTLTRPLADLDPAQVVRWKGLVGATLSFSVATILHEPLGPFRRCLALIFCGLTGYGISLRLYLRAQRVIGAGRTGSIFAVAPFIGAVAAWGLGDRTGGPLTIAAALLFAVGLYLHLTERHGHRHTHAALEHEHAHRHDDGHHDHVHDPRVEGEHSHVHEHDPKTHTHEHGLDVHHRHSHD